MMQLDLLTYQPTPEEMQPPLAPVQSAPKPSSGAIAWQYAKLNYFTKLMSKVIDRSMRDRQVAQALVVAQAPAGGDPGPPDDPLGVHADARGDLVVADLRVGQRGAQPEDARAPRGVRGGGDGAGRGIRPQHR